MKNIRLARVLAIVLMLAMVIGAFAGCGKKTDEELIRGKWAATIEFEKAMEAVLSESDADMFKDLDFSDISMDMNLEFKEDGTYAISVEKENAENAVKTMMERMVPALKEAIRTALAEGSGVDASEVTDEMMDSVLAYFGVDSWDAMAEVFMEQVDTDEMLKNINQTGKYLIKDGKLYTSTDDKDPAETEGQTYELNGKTLKITLAGKDVPDFMKELTFQRVG